MARLRFDLDGIPLDDEEGRTTAILRYRTTAGLILALPESVDVTVPWSDLAEASVDLQHGKITVRFVDGAGKKHRWLGAATVLSGAWTDRHVLETPPR
jgi:hypothetical protein